MPHLRQYAAALSLALSCVAGQATVLIDDFSDASNTTLFNGGLFESTGVQGGSMIGGGRFTGMLCYFDCYVNFPFVSTLTVGGGTLAVTPPPDGLATTRVLWGNTSSNNNVFPFASLSLDLSAETAFELHFGAISGGSLLVQFVVVSEGGLSVFSPVPNKPGVVLLSGAAQTLTLPFSSFVGVADFSSIKGLGLVLGGNNGAGTEAARASFVLDTVLAVPEAGTGPMLALGLLGLGAALRRRRVSAA